MGDKNRTFAAPSKSTKFKRPSTVTGATSHRSVPASAVKERAPLRPKVNKNATINDCDVTVRQESSVSDIEPVYRHIAYGKFLRAMLEDCIFSEKVEREETDMDVQMALLADRFKKTMDQLEKTNRRLKDISFVVEQKRLLDLRSQDCSKFYEMTDNSNVKNIVEKITSAEQSCLDKLETKNVDFGYNKESGHKQLLDTVNEAIDGLEQIKKHSKLDDRKFEEFGKSGTHLREMKNDQLDFESLKVEFEDKFPKFSEKLLKEVSEQVALMMKSDNEDENDGDEDDDD